MLFVVQLLLIRASRSSSLLWMDCEPRPRCAAHFPSNLGLVLHPFPRPWSVITTVNGRRGCLLAHTDAFRVKHALKPKISLSTSFTSRSYSTESLNDVRKTCPWSSLFVKRFESRSTCFVWCTAKLTCAAKAYSRIQRALYGGLADASTTLCWSEFWWPDSCTSNLSPKSVL